MNTVFSTNVLILLGRIGIAQLFILAGFHKIMYFHETLGVMMTHGIPLTESALILVIILEFGGGLLLLFGYHTKVASLMLLAFVALVTLHVHSYWEIGGAEQVTHIQHFLKNITIAGGLLYTLALGGGKYSMDRLRGS